MSGTCVTLEQATFEASSNGYCKHALLFKPSCVLEAKETFACISFRRKAHDQRRCLLMFETDKKVVVVVKRAIPNLENS